MHKANGGGIYKNTSAGVTMSNCTFAGNSAGGLGGGVYVGSSAFSAVHSIFWDNNDSTGVTYIRTDISAASTSPGQWLLFCNIADNENKFGGANNGNINDRPDVCQRAQRWR